MSDADRWKRIKEIFDAAVAAPVEDRAAVVRDVCGGDRALEAEVESLLVADVADGPVLRQPADKDLRERVFEAIADVFQNGTRTLRQGDGLGTYEIIGFLGAGGMGRVYRARDTTLGRDVALKILPEFLLADPDRRARFDREARLLASLNHPNIGAIYGVHESAPSPGTGLTVKTLVLELVEGETLADRISVQTDPRRGLPIDEVVSIASQVIEALEAAHERGIVHRDLKPANIKITPEGRVKVLDFGLARAVGGTGSQMADSPTITIGGTQGGLLMGTAPYMSPEQARGKVVDRRTDIWAFGCVLYEMLTGHQAFGEEDVQGTLARVIEREPDYGRLAADVPSGFRPILRRCLSKDLKKRYRDIGDVLLELHDALEDQNANAVSHPAPARNRLVWASWLVSAALAAGILALLVGRQRSDPPDPPARVEFTVPFAGAIDDEIAISPDGRHVVAEVQGRGLFVRNVSSASVRFVTGTEGDATTPVISPDGLWIAYVDQVSNELRRIPLAGGHPTTILKNKAGSFGMAWGPDGTIVYADLTMGLHGIQIAGGTPETLTEVNHAAQEEAHWLPEFLPGGRRVLFTVLRTPLDKTSIEVLDLDTRERTVVLTSAYHGRYLASGHLAFMRGETLWAVRFDARTLRTTGEPTLVVEGVGLALGEVRGAFAVSQNGTLAYLTAAEWNQESTLVWVDRSGAEQPAVTEPGLYSAPRLSADGARLAFGRMVRGRNDIWVTDPSQAGNLARITGDETDVSLPRPRGGAGGTGATWMPDGDELVYALPSPRSTIYRRRWQAGDPAVRIQPNAGDERPTSVSPDGRTLAYNRVTTTWDIWTLSLNGNPSPRPFRATSYDEGNAVFSPNGTWIAYESEETGATEIWLEPFAPGGGARRQISRGGALNPRWSADGQLFYRRGRALMSVLIDPATGAPQSSRELFSGDYRFDFDVSPDGRRFLMIKPLPGEDGAREITVVVNWFDELKRLVP
ncbi:MAG TPA: protein kinase [Vicinamibacterales bacterium]|nr:protein kinase [Vicinamibacterales bacterium]